MSTVFDRLPRGARVAIIRLRSLGDCVLTTPAIHILKTFRPDVEVMVAVEGRFAAVFEGNPDVTAIVEPTLTSIRHFHPELCLNLHGGNTSARLTALSGAPHRAGFAHFPFRFIYNERLPRAQEVLGVAQAVHTAEHLASAVFALGAPLQEIPRARLFAEPERRESAYAVIHPFASAAAKTWPAPFFLQAAQHLKRELDLQPVFLCGPGEDLSPFQMWPTLANLPLSRIKRLMAGASLFLGNDSGPAHMAAASGVPVAVLFGPSDPVVWAPWKTPSEVLVSEGPIHTISPQTAIRALDKLRVHA